MLNLGKTLLLSIFIFSSLHSAVVEAKLSRNPIVKGDSVELIITASGENIQPPKISKIGGFSIDGQATENFFHSVNGSIDRGYKFRYSFTPNRNSIIDPIEVIIDGESYRTERIELKVVEPTYNPNSPFTLRVISDKSELYRGETLKVDIEYKEVQNGSVIDRKYAPPKGENLWLKTNSEISQFQQSGYNFITISYFFTPQKSGQLSVDSAKMRVALRENQRDPFGFFIQSPKWKNVISNSLDLNVKESPQKLVGEYDIRVAVDKESVEVGKPINITLEIRGNGNIEDIAPFKLNIDSATVYEEKPKVEHRIENENYMGYFEQKFVVIPTKSFTINSFQITYFNPNKQDSFRVKTEPIEIEVIGAIEKRETLQVSEAKDNLQQKETDKTIGEFNYLISISAFLIGVIITLLATLKPWRLFKRWSFLRKIYKSDREALKKLLPTVGESDEVYTLAETLSKRIYRGEKIEVDRKRLKQFVKRAS